VVSAVADTVSADHETMAVATATRGRRGAEGVSSFVTVFEIARQSNGVWSDTVFRLVIGIAILVAGGTGVVLAWSRKGRSPKHWGGYLLIIGWSALWLFMHDFPSTFRHIEGLVEAYTQQHYQVVEGEVKVLREQPVTGHSRGDVIVVNGTQFEVNYFLMTPAYRDTIAHGGVLRNGVYARIYHQDGEILRVDIRRP
jgi:hypothetical protein